MRACMGISRPFAQSALALGTAASTSYYRGSMNGPMRAESKPLILLLIRHGESTVNVLEEDKSLSELRKNDFMSYIAECRKLPHCPDFPLSPLGEAQVERLRGYAPILRRYLLNHCGGGQACVFVSPHLRTCQSAAPLVDELRASNACRVWVKDDIYEVGGMNLVVDGPPNPLVRECRGQCGLSPKQIRDSFGYDTTLMAHIAEGSGWCTGNVESDSEGRERAATVAKWLLSDEFFEFCKAESNSHGAVMVILVTHCMFLNSLLNALLGIRADPSLDPNDDRNNPHSQATFFNHRNAAVSRLLIVGPSRRVIVEGLDEQEHLWATPRILPGAPSLGHISAPPTQPSFKENLHTKPGA